MNYYTGMTVIPLKSHTNHIKIKFNWIAFVAILHNRLDVCDDDNDDRNETETAHGRTMPNHMANE